MKIQQETPPYRPITIKFENHVEAKAFFSLMDKLDRYYSNVGEEFHHNDFTQSQRDLIIALVDSHESKAFR